MRRTFAVRFAALFALTIAGSSPAQVVGSPTIEELREELASGELAAEQRFWDVAAPPVKS